MKICMVAPLPPPYGGIGNWNLLLRAYCEKKNRHEFVYVNTAPKKQDIEVKNLWNRVVVKGFSMIGQRWKLKKLLAREGFDVMHITTSGRLAVVRDILFLRLAKKMRIPTVYHIHFGRIPQIASKNTFEWRMMKRAMRLSSRVIAIDRATLETIERDATGVKADFVPNPFDLDSTIESVASEAKTHPSVMFLGWVVRSKGIDLLIKAWETLKQEHRDWILRIVGPIDEGYAKTLRKNFSLENIVFEGEVPHDKAMELLANSNVFVLPSYTEGFPYSVLEAMSLEKAIVATDVGAIPDMLKDECGIVIPVGRCDALASALDCLMRDGEARERLGKNARCRLEKNYAAEHVMAQYEKIWLEACEKA